MLTESTTPREVLMKTTTVKAVVARTGRCGIHPVISQQGDNVLKRKGEKGVVKQETANNTTVQVFMTQQQKQQLLRITK